MTPRFPKRVCIGWGVGRQYCGALGKVANCQVAVTLHWSSGEASCPLGWRLFVPQQWFEDAKRAAEVKLPPDLTFRSKPELACELLDQVLGWGVPPLPLVSDSFYGDSYDFRQQLQQRQLKYVVTVEPQTQVLDPSPQTPPTTTQRSGRPRKVMLAAGLPPPQDLPTVAGQLPPSAWRNVTWREGSRGLQRCRFARLPGLGGARLALRQAGPACRRVVVDRMADRRKATRQVLVGPTGFALSRDCGAWCAWPMPAGGSSSAMRELKEELGLDHFEGRHWLG